MGTDGKLRAGWWPANGHILSSVAQVYDGLWHHVVFTVSSSGERLYLDGQLQSSESGGANLATLPNLNFGAGYIGGSWPDERYSGTGSTGYLDYFSGQIAAVTFTQ